MLVAHAHSDDSVDS